LTVLSPLTLPVPLQTALHEEGPLLIKSEASQWTNSAKYRMVYSRVHDALRSGRITAGTTLGEVTSGATGVALAYVGSVLGVPVEIHAFDTISPSRRSAIQDYGAKLTIHSGTTPPAQLLALVREKESLGDFWHLNQYDRPSAIAAYKDLGHELVRQIRERGPRPPRVFLCPVGTGGLIQGVGTVLRRAFPDLRILAIEPEAGALIEGTRNTDLFHLGPADPYSRSFPDGVLRVPAPSKTATLGDIPLGESSTAVYLVARSRRWGRTLILAPD
jgi:cysteine synthase A